MPDDLGAAISTHAQSKTLGGRIVMALFLAGPAVALRLRTCGHDVPLVPSDALGIVQAAFALVFLVLPGIALVVIANALRHKNDRVVLHEGGIVVTVLGRSERIAWSDVTSIASRVVRTSGGVVHRHVVKWRGGEIVLRESYDRIDDLVGAIRAKTAELLVPKAKADHDAGRAVDFGKLRFEQSALWFEGGKMPLSQLKSATVLSGTVTIRAKDGSVWLSLPVSDVPNVHVLLALFGEVSR